VRRLSVLFNVSWVSLFFFFQVIKRSALTICLLKTSVLLGVTCDVRVCGKGVRKGLGLNPLELDVLQKVYYLRKGD